MNGEDQVQWRVYFRKNWGKVGDPGNHDTYTDDIVR